MTSPATRHRLLHNVSWLLAGGVLFFYAWLNYRRYFPPFTPTFSLIVLLLLSAWGFWTVARRQRLARSPLALPLVVLLGSTALSTMFSLDMRRSFDGLLFTLAMVLFFFLFCDMLLAGVRPHLFTNAILCMATLALLVGLREAALYHWGWWQMRVPEYPVFLLPYRLFGITDHPNFLAALINLALPFAIIRMAQARTGVARALWAGWLLAFEVVLFLAHSRGGWLSASAIVAVSVGWLLLQQGQGPPWKGAPGAWFRRTWRIWAVLAVYVGVFLLLMRGSEWMKPESEFTTHGGATIQSAQSQRLALWRLAWRMFLEHPLVGGGPLTYGHAFVEHMVAVRLWVPSYAHNLPLEMLATRGIAGFLALLWVWGVGFWSFARVWGRRWFSQPPPSLVPSQNMQDEPLLICVCAALAGYMLHSQVDIIGKVATNDMIIVLLAALGLFAAGALHRDERRLSRWTGAVLVGPVVLAFVLLRYGAAQDAMLQGLLSALQRDWPNAAKAMDQATNNDPRFVFYYGQRGYAYGQLAVQERNHDSQERSTLATTEPFLVPALQSYRVSLRAEPPYLPNLLNTVAVLEQAEMDQQAAAILEQAVALEQARLWALPYLLHADRQATQGRMAEAQETYTMAFRAEEHAPQMAACRRSAACRAAAQSVVLEQEPDPVAQAHESAQALLAEDKPRQALAVLRPIPVTSSAAIPWIDRAEAHLALGEQEQARYALRVADRLRSNRFKPYAHTDARYAQVRAAFFLEQQQPEAATAALEQAVIPQLSREGYGYGVFRRVGLPGVLLPRLDLLQQTEEHLALYRQLAQHYASEERADDLAWARKQVEALETLLAEAEEEVLP